MFWLLLNVSLALIFVAVWTGVPLWLVLRHPDRGHQPQAVAVPAEPAQAEERELTLVA
jgi:hypothetical protein